MNIQAIDLAGFHMMEAHIYHTYCKTNKNYTIKSQTNQKPYKPLTNIVYNCMYTNNCE